MAYQQKLSTCWHTVLLNRLALLMESMKYTCLQDHQPFAVTNGLQGYVMVMSWDSDVFWPLLGQSITFADRLIVYHKDNFRLPHILVMPKVLSMASVMQAIHLRLEEVLAQRLQCPALLGAQGRTQQPLHPVPVQWNSRQAHQALTLCSLSRSIRLAPLQGRRSLGLFLVERWRMRKTHA